MQSPSVGCEVFQGPCPQGHGPTLVHCGDSSGIDARVVKCHVKATTTTTTAPRPCPAGPLAPLSPPLPHTSHLLHADYLECTTTGEDDLLKRARLRINIFWQSGRRPLILSVLCKATHERVDHLS